MSLKLLPFKVLSDRNNIDQTQEDKKEPSREYAYFSDD